ncbi:hypothetical protein NP493_3260g00006 [Ridgeia piscesae]|uniref:Uncharacterized protein n=1 Tax=Ridgeia piscesae TaxID=27915 RepID=A0AAD9J705_RIDPI|nr:hypothetical protein NP493_3260g00006 [Ridgeia piscesae]
MLLLQQDIFATEKALSVRLRSKLPAPRDLTRIKKQLNENGDRIRRFVSDFLHKAKYPLALDPICLIDEDWDPRKRPVTIHYVEGCVTDGVIVPWAISDVQYCRHKPTYLRSSAYQRHSMKTFRWGGRAPRQDFPELGGWGGARSRGRRKTPACRIGGRASDGPGRNERSEPPPQPDFSRKTPTRKDPSVRG